MKMEEQNNSFSKNIEVIWNRNNSTRGSKSLPVMKGINIEESAIKVKKSIKSNDFSRDISNDTCNVEHAHKRVKRSLFQENKNKCIPQAPTEDIEKFKNVNIHYQNIGRTNPVDSDIIESSEIINLFNKKKTKKNKVHCSKNTKTSNKNELRGTNNFDSCSLIYTDNMLKSPRFDFRIKNSRKKSKPLIIEPQENQNLGITDNEINRYGLDTCFVSAPLNSKTFDEKMSKKDLRMVESSYNANDLKIDQDKSKLCTHSSEITVIPATPEHEAVNMSRSAIEYSPEISLNSIVPLIEVDQSPKTPHGKSHNILIQSVQTPPQNKCSIILQDLFESVTSPTQSFISPERPFKIDTIESPSAVSEYEDIFEVEICKNKTKGSPSPNRFDSAKKRRKISKDGLRGKFRDLINRKKSEACIREYEKNLSKSYQLKECETALLYVIEAWKEFRTFVLLCYLMNSETEVEKVLVTLENCPKNVTKNSIIRIYSPWLTIKSGNTGILLFIGVIHIEVVEFSGSTRVLEPIGLFTNVKGLLTTVFQNEVVWECNCSEENACQCLGELSSFNYLKYIIS